MCMVTQSANCNTFNIFMPVKIFWLPISFLGLSVNVVQPSWCINANTGKGEKRFHDIRTTDLEAHWSNGVYPKYDLSHYFFIYFVLQYTSLHIYIFFHSLSLLLSPSPVFFLLPNIFGRCLRNLDTSRHLSHNKSRQTIISLRKFSLESNSLFLLPASLGNMENGHD